LSITGTASHLEVLQKKTTDWLKEVHLSKCDALIFSCHDKKKMDGAVVEHALFHLADLARLPAALYERLESTLLGVLQRHAER